MPPIANSGSLDARQFVRGGEQPLRKRNTLIVCGIPLGRQLDIYHQNVTRLKSRIAILKQKEAADGEVGSDEKHDGERHLGHHQEHSGSGSLEPRRKRSSRVLQRVHKVGPRTLQSRHKSEKDPCGYRNASAEHQRIKVDSDARFIRHIGIGDQRNNRFRDSKSTQHA